MCRSLMSDTEMSSGWAPDSLPIISPVWALMKSSATPAGATVTVFFISSSGGRCGIEPVEDSISRQILQLSLEQSRVALPSIDPIKDYHSLRLPLLPMIQRKIGEEVWTKLELWHRGELEYATVLDPVSKNLRRDCTRDRQGPGDLLTLGRLDLLDPFFQLG